MRRVAFGAVMAAGLTLAVSGSLAPAANEPEYSIGVEAPTSATVGEQASLRIALIPAAGRSISKDGPVRISAQVVPKDGLSLSRSRFRRRHAAEPTAATLRFSADLKSESVGTYQLAIDIRFWICARKTCRPVREHRQVDVAIISEPSDAGDAGPTGPTTSTGDGGTSDGG